MPVFDICLLTAGFESHAHLQAGLASLAGTPQAVHCFFDQAHAASRTKVGALLLTACLAQLYTSSVPFQAGAAHGVMLACPDRVSSGHCHHKDLPLHPDKILLRLLVSCLWLCLLNSAKYKTTNIGVFSGT